MKSRSFSIIAIAAAGALLAAPVSAKTTPTAQSYNTTPTTPATPTRASQAKPVDDKTLSDRIDAKVKADVALRKFDVDVAVKDGVATLTGRVRTEAERVRAGRDAHVPGVLRVENRLVVDKDAGNGVVDKVKSASETVGEKTKSGASKTGEVITDAWMTTKVHSRFMGEDLLKGSDISVGTNNHVVTLKGTVKSEAGRARAMEIARTTDGVTKVVDQLSIK
jgi:osmotically-inducible protein OsmY